MAMYDPRQLDPTLEDAMWGLPPEEAIPEYQPQQFRGNRFLEAFAGVQPGNYQPQSLGSGFLQGLVGGLSSQGQRIQAQREKFDALQEQRRKEVDAERRQAKNKREEQRFQAIKEYRNQPLKEIQGPPGTEGPVYARQSEAVGQPAYVKPEKPEKTLTQIEAEAEARARGGRRGAPPIPKGGTGEPKPATIAERTALGFYNRAKEADDIIGGLDASKISPTKVLAAMKNPLANPFLSGPEQAMLQASRQFTQAKLRRESGATITTDEYATDFKTFFASPGDRPETIAQKAAAREAVLGDLKFQAGNAYGEYYGDQTAGGTKNEQNGRKRGAQNSEQKAAVRQAAINQIKMGNIDSLDQFLSDNPWLDNDPEIEAALDEAGVPR